MNTLLENFTPNSVWFGFSGLLVIVVSFILFERKNSCKVSFILLLLGALLIRIAGSFLDPFLNLWDEQFHAVVAKNLAHENWSKPMLYHNPVMPYDYTYWPGNHIWLHKQPFFLYLIAISIKFLGVNLFAVRLPSILFSVVLTAVIFRMGELIHSRKAGYYSAILFVFSYFFINLAAGYQSTDHNDMIFIVLVNLSIWSFLEYIRSAHSTKWMIWTSLFISLAVLTKWLSGLLVFGAWVIYLIQVNAFKNNRQLINDFLRSLSLCAMLILPWQLYTLIRFPVESMHEYRYASQHINQAVEGHEGTAWYHFDMMQYNFFRLNYLYVWVILSLIIYAWFFRKKEFTLPILTLIIGTFGFYTFAATKMAAYCAIIYPIWLIVLMSVLLDFFQRIASHLNGKWLRLAVITVVPILTIYFAARNFNSGKFIEQHSLKMESPLRNDRIAKINATQAITSLNLPSNTIIFNCRDLETMSILFFTNYLAYERFPDEANINRLIDDGYTIAYWQDEYTPKYFADNPEIIKLSRNDYSMTQ
jgi:4-amino-4-deoxy-L-arabinose transferase-like glycosyltransferase